ncbi:tetratricopeptide repeat protein [Hymenobacter busanensis]|uniref:histidine kinase n=1 Tax=Hymenobacter busanensis TaxID=2607656 RepID=A0A7L5A387_9BACT|nr:ATP-binding protein [Hymenobacter busanensis]KAA9333026.1 tetratricopeptide repeat protein [Hymenobacter busanensis]QHJ08300.1 tetratricopeptide repeat protein [Hymenobacter busanensis]
MIHRGFVLLALLLIAVAARVAAQSPQTPSLHRALAAAKSDTSRVLLLADLSASYRYSRFDSVQAYAQQGLALARRLGYRKGEGRCISRLGILMSERGNLPQALRTDLQALQLNEESHDLEGMARTLNQIGLLYYALEDYRPALSYFFRAQRLYAQARIADPSQLVSVLTNIGASYEGRSQFDSAAVFLNRAYHLTDLARNHGWSCWGNPTPYVLRELGLLEASQGRPAEALLYYRRSVRAAGPENDRRSACRAYQYMSELYHQRQQSDSSVYYARKALQVGQSLPFVMGVVRTSNLLADAFRARGLNDSTLKYLQILHTAEDSLYNPQRIKQLDAIGFAEQQRLRQLEDEQLQLAERTRTYALLAGLAAALLVAGLLWRTNRLQHRTNARLRTLHNEVTQQKQEITTQRDKLARMLHELKVAQSQLVLREKMASLGELMAGVAYEIQHPVNSVKNFAGISVSLVDELRKELAKLPLELDDREYLAEMLDNLSQNQSKIVQFSQRADSVVRGMLEYSSSAPGPRQPTELNAFVEDYLRLTYHDARAKNRNFHAALFPHLSPEVGTLSVVRHDIGRALINLFTNAFYAVQQRLALDEDDYVPQVTVTTRALDGRVEIRVRDNGLGIPAAALPNVFDQFFSTKPPEEGPGLGLTLSHELITKGHGGTLTVETQEGEFTEFIISLPVQ